MNIEKILEQTIKETLNETIKEKGIIADSLYKKVWPLLEKRLVMPQIYVTYKLEEASKAHYLMESSKHIGKIVLTV